MQSAERPATNSALDWILAGPFYRVMRTRRPVPSSPVICLGLVLAVFSADHRRRHSCMVEHTVRFTCRQGCSANNFSHRLSPALRLTRFSIETALEGDKSPVLVVCGCPDCGHGHDVPSLAASPDTRRFEPSEDMATGRGTWRHCAHAPFGNIGRLAIHTLAITPKPTWNVSMR